MTTEQLKELAEALSILSAHSSVMKERAELRELMEENIASDEVGKHSGFPSQFSALNTQGFFDKCLTRT